MTPSLGTGFKPQWLLKHGRPWRGTLAEARRAASAPARELYWREGYTYAPRAIPPGGAMTDDVIHLRLEADPARGCEVHEWTLDDFRTMLVPVLRARHGKGGLNACVECLRRARDGIAAAGGR